MCRKRNLSHASLHALCDYAPRTLSSMFECRQRNFSVELVGATTEDALLEKRAAEYEAAEAVRLKVGHPLRASHLSGWGV